MSGPLHVRLVTTEADLASLADDWNRMAGGVPFRRFDWLEPWWRHYRLADWRLFTLVVEDAANHPVAIAPWYMARSASDGRVVRLLGSGEVCSEYLTVLTENGCEAAAATALADWLSCEGERRLGFAAAGGDRGGRSSHDRAGERIRKSRANGA